MLKDSSPPNEVFASAVAALFECEPLSPLRIHAGLYHLCTFRMQRLLAWRNRRAWFDFMVEKEAEAVQELDLRDSQSVTQIGVTLAREASAALEERYWAGVVGVLKALDRLHRRERLIVAYEEIKLPEKPSALGGATLVYLPQPQRPIENTLAESNSSPLNRRPSDFRSDLSDTFGLYWSLIELDSSRYRVRPRFWQLEQAVSLLFERRLATSPDLRIGLASPCRGYDYSIAARPSDCHSEDGVPYRFTCLACDPAEARQGLRHILESCKEHKVGVLCFPELALDTHLLGHLCDLLRLHNDEGYPALVIAGSFHHEDTGNRTVVNRCHVLDSYGRLLVQQDKCKPFKIPAAEARQMNPELLQKLGIDERGGYEDIEPGEELVILDSPLGRMATPICLDFCGDHLRQLLVDASVNLLWVPAMTPSMAKFRKQSRDLGDLCRAASFIVNNGWLLHQLGKTDREIDQDLAACYLPCRTDLSREVTDVEGPAELKVFSFSVILGK